MSECREGERRTSREGCPTGCGRGNYCIDAVPNFRSFRLMDNTCYDSYSVLVVLCRIIHTLLPSLPLSLPVQFGTGFVSCIRTPYSVLGQLLSPSHGLARVSYSVFVFRILYWVDPSLPVQFGTGFVSCIRIPYSVLGRPLSRAPTPPPHHGIRVQNTEAAPNRDCERVLSTPIQNTEYEYSVRILRQTVPA